MLHLTGSKGVDAKEMVSLGANEDIGDAVSRSILGCHITTASMNSADGGSFFLCFFFL